MSARTNGLDRSPIHLLHRAGQAVDIIFGAEMKADLTPRQLAVLVSVSANPGANQSRLVEVTGIDRSTLADLARRLQRKGLLQRRRTKADARAYEVNLTAEGNRILRAAMPAWEKIETRILNTLPPGRREQFLDGLQTIIRALEPVTTER
jgi:DNA-binding MarR family transcriptional regulator